MYYIDNNSFILIEFNLIKIKKPKSNIYFFFQKIQKKSSNLRTEHFCITNRFNKNLFC